MADIKRRTVTRKKPVQTVEEKILGVEPVAEKVTIVDYENPNRLYKVTNLQVANSTPSTFSGAKIETFIGCKNEKARNELIAGAKSVITVNGNGKEAYKIEVI